MPGRRSQAERSDATRAALSEAAIELLVERGWAATTSVAICDRAGVTRGAMLHHYDGLSDLLAAALQRLYGRFAEDRSAPTTMVGVVDEMWSVIADAQFKAAIEAWMAAGNEPELGAAIGPVIADFAKLVHPDQRLVAAVSAGASRRDEAITFTLLAREALLGLGLGRASAGGRPLPHESTVLERLRADAAGLDQAANDAATD